MYQGVPATGAVRIIRPGNTKNKCWIFLLHFLFKVMFLPESLVYLLFFDCILRKKVLLCYCLPWCLKTCFVVYFTRRLCTRNRRKTSHHGTNLFIFFHEYSFEKRQHFLFVSIENFAIHVGVFISTSQFHNRTILLDDVLEDKSWSQGFKPSLKAFIHRRTCNYNYNDWPWPKPMVRDDRHDSTERCFLCFL